MGLKEIGKRIGDMAFRVAASGCGCGGECGKCASCGNLPAHAPGGETESCGKGKESKEPLK